MDELTLKKSKRRNLFSEKYNVTARLNAPEGRKKRVTQSNENERLDDQLDSFALHFGKWEKRSKGSSNSCKKSQKPVGVSDDEAQSIFPGVPRDMDKSGNHQDNSVPSSQADRSVQRANRLLRKEALGRTVFVGNLPAGVKKSSLKKLFARALKQDGAAMEANCRVESVRFRGVVPITGGTGKLARKRAVIHREFSAGVSQNLIAYVVLTSVAGIPAALSLNGHWLEPEENKTDAPADTQSTGKHIRVDRSHQHATTEKLKQSVFLGNLPFDAQEEEVRSAMSKFGVITNVRLIRDKETGAVKGFGFVHYADPTVIPLAIRASGSVSIRDRPIRIQEWKPVLKSDKHDRSVKKPKQSRSNSKCKTAQPPPKDGNGDKKNKYWKRLVHKGQVKGVTLPSNLKGEQRARFLQKRLIKKRKRELRRKQQQPQQQSQLKFSSTQASGKQKRTS